MIKGLIQQEGIIIINIWAPNIRAHKYIKQILTDLKDNTNDTIIRGTSTPTFNNGYKSIQKANQKMADLNNTYNKWTSTDI